MSRTTSREMFHRIQAIKDGLDLKNEHLLNLLVETRKIDDLTIEECLKSEGKMMAQKDFIYTLENLFLETQTLKTIREYKDKPSEDWSFLDNTERTLIYNTIKLLKKTSLEYRLTRAELMILRKEVIDFVKTRLSSIKSDKKPQDIINIIINNYTYLDSLNALGYTIQDDEILEI